MLRQCIEERCLIFGLIRHVRQFWVLFEQILDHILAVPSCGEVQAVLAITFRLERVRVLNDLSLTKLLEQVNMAIFAYHLEK